MGANEKPLTVPESYRTAKTSDIPALVELAWSSYGQYAPFLTPEHFDTLKKSCHDEKKWEEIIAGSESFLVHKNDRLSGMAFLFSSGKMSDLFEPDWSYIRMLGVDPELQGQGTGRKLTELCIQRARSNGEKTIALHTSEIMKAARHIYESYGFRMHHEIPPRLGLKYSIYTLDLHS
jgi:GNAT superfamily N-acetyltransferase